MASLQDKITETFNGQNPTSTTVANTRSDGGTTLVCDSLAGWPTTTAVHFATYQKDNLGKKMASSQTDWKGIVSGSSINSLTRQGGAADSGNTTGDVVEMMPTNSWAQDLATGLEAEHSTTGAHKIIDFTNSTHNHQNAAGGGVLQASALGTDSSWAWNTWTPSWTGSSIGNSVVNARYRQNGKSILFKLDVTFGSSFAIAVGADTTFTLPVTSVPMAQFVSPLGPLLLYSAGQGVVYSGASFWNSTTTGALGFYNVSGSLLLIRAFDSTYISPSAGDGVSVSGFYEAA